MTTGYRDVSILIPAGKDEDPEWVQQLVGSVLMDQAVSEILIITQGDPLSFPLNSNEKVRKRQQSDPRGKKSRALNDGLAMVRAPYLIAMDADILLRGDEIWRTVAILEGADGKDPVDFAAAGYGNPLRPNPFPIFSFGGGWFFAARANVLRSLGGWPEGEFVEDAALSRRILQAGFRIQRLPFNVQLRRGPRNPIVKALSAIFTR